MKSSSVVLLVAVAVLACGRRPNQTSAEGAANEIRDNRNVTKSPVPTDPDTHVVSQSGMGRIRLQMTLEEARRALPVAKFERTSDGDGAALVEVTLAPDEPMILWADEDDSGDPIDWSKTIKAIETFSPAFHTVEGVHPGSLVTDVEMQFGKTREIEKSEVESREYITFEKQPSYLTLRLDYTGIFLADSRQTTKFEPDAKILSIAVSMYSTN